MENNILDQNTIEFFIALVGFAVIVASGAVWLRSSLAKQRHDELEHLADTRGDIIEDQNRKIEWLEGEVAALRAELKVLRETFTRSLVDDIVAGVRQGLKQ